MSALRLNERPERSFEEMALEVGNWTEESLWVEPDQDDAPCEPDWRSSARIDTTERAFGYRSHTPDPGNAIHGWTASGRPAHQASTAKKRGGKPAIGKEAAPEPWRASQTAAATTPLDPPSSASVTGSRFSTSAPLSQLARLLGRSWARDRRERMVEGLGGGLRVWRGL